VPSGTNVTSLAATFTTSAGVSSVKVGSLSQVSGTTANNFTNPVTYVVTAQDGSHDQELGSHSHDGCQQSRRNHCLQSARTDRLDGQLTVLPEPSG